jgi:hypothetical protein
LSRPAVAWLLRERDEEPLPLRRLLARRAALERPDEPELRELDFAPDALRLVEPDLRLVEPDLRLALADLRLVEPDLRLVLADLRPAELRDFWLLERAEDLRLLEPPDDWAI